MDVSNLPNLLGGAIDKVKHFFNLSSYSTTEVQSNIDGKKYRVRDMPDKQHAADMLAQLRLRMIKMKIHLDSTYPDKVQVRRLVKNFHDDPSRFIESTPDAEFTSYSVNKGESVYFCLRQREGENEDLVNLDVMVFVALHEMGHMITESIGHDEQFWNNFAWLLKEAESAGIYSYQNFKAHPVAYCGIKITDQPTYDPGKDGTDLTVGTAQ
jgi:hypothetical protein